VNKAIDREHWQVVSAVIAGVVVVKESEAGARRVVS
jgi:hypothetical protein